MKTHEEIRAWNDVQKQVIKGLFVGPAHPCQSVTARYEQAVDIITQLLSELSGWQPWADRPDNWRDLAHNGQLEIKCKADYEDHYNGGRDLFLPTHYRLPQSPSNEETSA